MEERRKFPRIDKNSTLEYKTLDFPITEDGFLSSRIENISGNGLVFISGKKFEIGSILHLRVGLIGWHKEKNDFYKYDETAVSEPLLILARVVRITELKKSQSYEIGAEFINVSKEDHKAMISFIDKTVKSV